MSYDSKVAVFFLKSCLTLPKDRLSCVFEQFDKFNKLTQDEKSKQDLNELTRYYVIQANYLDKAR
jgi:hypothetical protein